MSRKPSRATLEVLAAMLADTSVSMYGLQLCKATGLRPGSLYPILTRLEDDGRIEGTWEELDPSEEGRPRRRYYSLTPDGMAYARHELRSLQIGTALRPGMAR